jgi:hypothetical protein
MRNSQSVRSFWMFTQASETHPISLAMRPDGAATVLKEGKPAMVPDSCAVFLQSSRKFTLPPFWA